MMILLGSTLKVSALILAGLAGAAAARRHSAAARHWVIAASLLCALAIPALERYRAVVDDTDDVDSRDGR